jgi:hypothetical protein
VLKVQHKPIKRYKLGFKRKEQKKPKRTLVWRIGLSGVPPDIVRCTKVDRLQVFTFGFLDSRSAIIHWTVRWVTGLSGVPVEQRLPSATVDSNGRLTTEQCADSSRKSEHRQKAHRTVNSDCPVPQAVRAPTVKTVRTTTVG